MSGLFTFLDGFLMFKVIFNTAGEENMLRISDVYLHFQNRAVCMQNQQQCHIKLELTFNSSLTLSCLFSFHISGVLFKGPLHETCNI